MGDCFNHVGAPGSSDVVDVVDCEDPHQGQVYYTAEFDMNTATSDSGIEDSSYDACEQAVANSLKPEALNQNFAWSYFWPSLAQYQENGTDSVVCYIHQPTMDNYTGDYVVPGGGSAGGVQR